MIPTIITTLCLVALGLALIIAVSMQGIIDAERDKHENDESVHKRR